LPAAMAEFRESKSYIGEVLREELVNPVFY
jgi:hypothetical protein